MTQRWLCVSICSILTTSFVACSSESPVAPSHASGGSPKAGGAVGSAGGSSQGGTTASGESSGYGGSVGSGGASETGGRSTVGSGGAGSGGITGSGGSQGRGGASSGGSTGSGGNTAFGGAIGSGGNTAFGGTIGSGGRTGSGGTTVSGGTTAPDASAGTGGSIASGGMVASGGNVGSGGRVGTGGAGTGGATTPAGDPPSGTMRVFYLRPSDVPFDQKFPDGIGQIMVEAQTFYKQQLGKTFKLNDPIVEVVVGEHVKSWYENTANGGDKYWWSATNAEQEIQRRFKLPDKRWMGVSEVSAEGDGAGGGGTGGWVLLCGHDADGGKNYPAEKARWVGGMVHELGHAFSLPDANGDDGTCMSAAFYGWPKCTFTQSQKDQMLNGAWGSGKFLF